MFAETLERIDSKIAKEKDLLSRAFSEKASGRRRAGASHEHSPECFRLQKYSNRRIGNYRHLFYRHLVSEYERSFGDDSPKVASVMNLLASVLIDSKRFDEAEENLIASLKISTDADLANAKALMERLEKAKVRRTNSKR